MKKKAQYRHREGGPASIRTTNRKGEQTDYSGSSSVDLETGPFEFLKKGGFVELVNTDNRIVEIKTERIVTANTEDVGEAGIEFIGEAKILMENVEHKIKVKLFTTSCSVQSQGDKKCYKTESEDKKSPPQYFSDIVVKFITKVAGQNPELYNKFIPENIEERIQMLQNKNLTKKPTNKKVDSVNMSITASKRNMIEYSETKEDGSQESLYQCNHCKFNTKKKQGIKQHITRQHSHQSVQSLVTEIKYDKLKDKCQTCFKEIMEKEEVNSCKLCNRKEHRVCSNAGKQTEKYICFDCSLKSSPASIEMVLIEPGRGLENQGNNEEAVKLVEEQTNENVSGGNSRENIENKDETCLLYTSDAADE